MDRSCTHPLADLQLAISFQRICNSVLHVAYRKPYEPDSIRTSYATFSEVKKKTNNSITNLFTWKANL